MKKKRNLVGNCLGNSQQNYYIVGKKKDMRRKGKKGGMKTGADGKIPQDKET